MASVEAIEQLEKICEGLDYEVYQDELLMANAEIGASHYGLELSQCTPTFILKADNNYIAVIIQGNRKLDFKKIKQYLGAKKVEMATREDILNVTGSSVGSVSLINPNLKTLIDSGVKDLEYCYGGCGVEKHTLKINPTHLIKITDAVVGDFSKLRLE